MDPDSGCSPGIGGPNEAGVRIKRGEGSHELSGYPLALLEVGKGPGEDNGDGEYRATDKSSDKVRDREDIHPGKVDCQADHQKERRNGKCLENKPPFQHERIHTTLFTPPV